MNFLAENFILESCLKILLSAVMGIFFGIERRNHLHAIGIRTMLLITSSCALLGILSYYGADNPAALGGDPTRIAAGVVTGIGFLGGSVILRHGLNIKGITTAAIIWTAAALGLSIGYGLYVPSIAFFAFVFVMLPIFKAIEKRIFPASKIKTVRLRYSKDDADIDAVKKVLVSAGMFLRDINYSSDFTGGKFEVEILANTPSWIDFSEIGKGLKESGSLLSFSIL